MHVLSRDHLQWCLWVATGWQLWVSFSEAVGSGVRWQLYFVLCHPPCHCVFHFLSWSFLSFFAFRAGQVSFWGSFLSGSWVSFIDQLPRFQRPVETECDMQSLCQRALWDYLQCMFLPCQGRMPPPRMICRWLYGLDLAARTDPMGVITWLPLCWTPEMWVIKLFAEFSNFLRSSHLAEKCKNIHSLYC